SEIPKEPSNKEDEQQKTPSVVKSVRQLTLERIWCLGWTQNSGESSADLFRENEEVLNKCKEESVLMVDQAGGATYQTSRCMLRRNWTRPRRDSPGTHMALLTLRAALNACTKEGTDEGELLERAVLQKNQEIEDAIKIHI
ncbi:transforming acidic coiled-coil-containing protein 1 isoform X1, partial [Lates japonicus]